MFAEIILLAFWAGFATLSGKLKRIGKALVLQCCTPVGIV